MGSIILKKRNNTTKTTSNTKKRTRLYSMEGHSRVIDTVEVPRLRVLIDPIYIQYSNLAGSSTYKRYEFIVEELVRRGHFVYWCIPDTRNDYVPSALESNPNVGVIRTAEIPDQFLVDGLMSDKFFNLFNRVSGKYHVDVVVTSRVGMAHHYKRVLEAPRFLDSDVLHSDKSYGLPIIISEGFPQTMKRQKTAPSYALSHVIGYNAADKTVFLSEHNRDEIVAEMSDYLLSSKVKKFIDKTEVIPAGVDCKFLDSIYSEDRWTVESGFNVLCVGRIFGESYAEYLNWFDYLFKGGLSDCTLTVSLSGKLSGPIRGKLKSLGFDMANIGKQFKILENNTRDNFIRMVRKFHCFICPVSHYDHPAGLFEVLYLGLPGIIPESDYQKTFFPDYPFVIKPKDKASLVATLSWIRDNTAEAREMVKPYKEKIRALYDSYNNRNKIVDVIESVSRNKINEYRLPKAAQNFLNELKGKEYNLADICKYLRGCGNVGVVIGDVHRRITFTYSIAAIHHGMRRAGFVDVCDSPDVKFVRKDIFDKEYK